MTSKRVYRRPSRRQRGLTLLELIVGVFIAIFLTAAAVAFAAHETRLMGISRDKLDVSQASRAAIDLLVSDLSMAGGGVGFDETGAFQGLNIGPFFVGSCGFNLTGSALTFAPGTPPPPGSHTPINLRTVGPQGTRPLQYSTRTIDILLRYADGAYATIANYGGAGGQFCMSPGTRYGPNELVLLRDETGTRFTGGQITTNNGVVPCIWGNCVNGCVDFTIAPGSILNSSVTSPGVNYVGGEIAGGYKEVVWFVASDGADGTLRRAVFDQPNPTCTARDNTLGGAVAENVETIQVQLYQFITNPALANPPQWVHMGQRGLSGRDRYRTRLDVEVVMRTRRTSDAPKMPIPYMLQANLCAPNTGACTQPQDFAERRAYRTSVEIRNAALFHQ